MRWDMLDAFRDAAEQAGIRKIDDFNGGDNFGSCLLPGESEAGRRWSAARGFLKPVLGRSNLRLETGVLAERISSRTAGRSASPGSRGGERRTARRGRSHAGGGAIGSPQLLELSGIGDGARLQALGVAPLVDL